MALTVTNGPAAAGFSDRLQLGGFSCNAWDGQIQWTDTDTVGTLTLQSGGQTSIRFALFHLNAAVANNTISYTISGDNMVLTRGDATANSTMSVFIAFN